VEIVQDVVDRQRLRHASGCPRKCNGPLHADSNQTSLIAG
jgi:hypothetical protein